MRDDFTEDVKRALAQRVANRRSNPECGAVTSGPQIDPAKAVNVGVAAHLTAASPGGPRYDDALTPAQRGHASNGLWLCQTCAKRIDSDPVRFTSELLREWRARAEAAADAELGKSNAASGEGIADCTPRASESYRTPVVRCGLCERVAVQGANSRRGPGAGHR